MPSRVLSIGAVTDEISRDLEEALAVASGWGIERFELREGGTARFPRLTPREIGLVEDQVRAGARITSVSPGILKGSASDAKRTEAELTSTLPASIELAQRFGCPTLNVFGFERAADEPLSNRLVVMRTFERVAEAAAEAGMTVTVENEPGFWIDTPAETAAMFDEIGHPALRANWDPANLQWGGVMPDYEGFSAVRPFLAGVHVKDFTPDDAEAPWRPVGEGIVPWRDLLTWIVEETDLPHVTLETHCVPLLESSARSLEALRTLISDIP